MIMIVLCRVCSYMIHGAIDIRIRMIRIFNIMMIMFIIIMIISCTHDYDYECDNLSDVYVDWLMCLICWRHIGCRSLPFGSGFVSMLAASSGRWQAGAAAEPRPTLLPAVGRVMLGDVLRHLLQENRSGASELAVGSRGGWHAGSFCGMTV